MSAISIKKKILFSIILVLIPVIIIVALEGCLRLFNYGRDMSLFIKSEKYTGYYQINQDAGLRYFTKFKNTSFTDDVFLINKPDSCFRIFVLGESTTRGFPFQESTCFPRILYFRLQEAFPKKRIEVVNISASALSSFILVDMVDEILANKPDAILVYAGHNEYYGTLGIGSVEGGGNKVWMKKLRLRLIRLRTFQLIKNGIAKIASGMFEDSGAKDDGTLMERIVKNKSIATYSKQYYAGIEQYKSNLEEFVRKTQKQHIPILISDLVCNIKDQQPLGSEKIDTIPAAMDIYNKAKLLEQQGKYTEAKGLYYRAKDLDMIKFRAPEAINLAICDIVSKYNLSFVSMKSAFEAASANGLIGNNLMMEHLHPNVEGYFLMAETFFQAMKKNKFIADNWDTTLIKPSSYYRNNWGFTELDSLIGDLNIKVIKEGWPFKQKNEIEKFYNTFQTNGVVDSMAFRYVAGLSKHIEEEHMRLAVFYASLDLNEQAFKEYLSLIRMHPYIMDLYYDASKYLIAQQKYKEAYDLIMSSPNKTYDYFYYYMLGTLKLKLLDYNNAIKDLEYANSIISKKENPAKVLLPLYLAYKEVGDSAKAKKLSPTIRKYIPGFDTKETTVKKPKMVKKVLSVAESNNLALKLMKGGNTEEALKILLITIQKEETRLGNKLLGAIYFQKKDDETALKYFSKAYQFDNSDTETAMAIVILLLKHNNIKSAEQLVNNLKLHTSDLSKIQRLEKMIADKKGN